MQVRPDGRTLTAIPSAKNDTKEKGFPRPTQCYMLLSLHACCCLLRLVCYLFRSPTVVEMLRMQTRVSRLTWSGRKCFCSLSLSLYIYIYVCICIYIYIYMSCHSVNMYVYIYIYIYILHTYTHIVSVVAASSGAESGPSWSPAAAREASRRSRPRSADAVHAMIIYGHCSY